MNVSKDLRIDIFLHRLKAQTPQKIFDFIAHELQFMPAHDVDAFHHFFETHWQDRTFAIEDGLAVFDAQTALVQKTITVIASVEHRVSFEHLDYQVIDLVACVISPKAVGARHLQYLAELTRVLKSEELRMNLRSARDVDGMKVLFQPQQHWMIAA